MKITDKRTKKEITFDTLETGELFEYLDNIHLKLDYRKKINNAFNFRSNTLETFLDEVVTPVEAELVIYGEYKK